MINKDMEEPKAFLEEESNTASKTTRALKSVTLENGEKFYYNKIKEFTERFELYYTKYRRLKKVYGSDQGIVDGYYNLRYEGRIKVVIHGEEKEFISISDLAKELGVLKDTFRCKLNRNEGDFQKTVDYYLDKQDSTNVRVFGEDRYFSSIKDLSEFYGKWRGWVRELMKKGEYGSTQEFIDSIEHSRWLIHDGKNYLVDGFRDAASILDVNYNTLVYFSKKYRGLPLRVVAQKVLENKDGNEIEIEGEIIKWKRYADLEQYFELPIGTISNYFRRNKKATVKEAILSAKPIFKASLRDDYGRLLLLSKNEMARLSKIYRPKLIEEKLDYHIKDVFTNIFRDFYKFYIENKCYMLTLKEYIDHKDDQEFLSEREWME